MTDNIQTIAELAIAMAGFAGVVFVVGPERASKVDLFRITNLLALSFATMISAIVSLALIAFELGAELQYRLSSAVLFLLAGSLTGFYSLPTYYRLRVPSRSTISRVISLTGVPIVILNLLLSLLNAAGMFGARTGAVFLLTLVLMLVLCSIQFMAGILDRESGPKETPTV